MMPPPNLLLYESHCHTPLCKHAVGSPRDYARMAQIRGLRGIIFTCHCPLPDGLSAGVRMAPEDYDEYIAIVADAHRPERIADGYAAALRQLGAVGYREVSYFLDRKRHTVPMAEALASLR